MFKVGDTVRFGRPNGEQTMARVERVNGKSLSVVTLEERGRAGVAGKKWRVATTLCTLAPSGTGDSFAMLRDAALGTLPRADEVVADLRAQVAYLTREVARLTTENDRLRELMS